MKIRIYDKIVPVHVVTSEALRRATGQSWDGRVGSSVWDRNARCYRIFLKKGLSRRQKRITLWHEIAHLIVEFFDDAHDLRRGRKHKK